MPPVRMPPPPPHGEETKKLSGEPKNYRPASEAALRRMSATNSACRAVPVLE
jgi:hypothetical protein